MSDNEGGATKRTFSKVDSEHDADDDERRDLIRAEMANVASGSRLVDTQWLNQFFSGDNAPVLLAKGEAGTRIANEAFKHLEEWFGIRVDAVAVRVAHLERQRPVEVLVLETSNSLAEALNVDVSHWFYAANVPSAFVDKSTLAYPSRLIDPGTTVNDLELESNETLVVENPNNRALGRTGLGNMGNTCFMNSALQCLLHIPELTTYFLSGDYLKDLNPENPIGCKGEVAEAFANLAVQAFTERSASFRPVSFRATIGKYNRSFANRMQQDSQEFTTFLLDSLHEDLNRVRQKPATTEPELGDNEQPSESVVQRLAHESWKNHKKRNDSKIMELFTGMYKSTLICPVCDKVSVRFDPFFDLTLPLPSSTYWVHSVVFVPWETDQAPLKIDVALAPPDSVYALKSQVAQLTGTLPERLIAGDVFQQKFYRLLNDSSTLADTIETSDVIVLYDVGPREHDGSDGTLTPTAVPVYAFSTHYQGHPFYVSITSQTSKDEIRLQIRSRLEQFVGTVPSFTVKVFDGSIDDLAYTVDQGRTWNLDEPERGEHDDEVLSGPLTPPSEHEEGEESFETIALPRRQSEDNGEQLRSPDQSPGSSSISPLSERESPPQINLYGNADEAVVPRARRIDPSNTVLLVEFSSDTSLEDADPAFRIVENPEAVRAKAVIEAHRTTSLEDCLNRFAQPEILGENDLWYCPRCKEFRHAQKQIELWRVPDVLMIHLKRFSGSMMVSKKINDLVTFPFELDISKHLSNATSADDSMMYDLFAVDNHYGGMGGGHYTAYVWDVFKMEWLNFNDSFVSAADPASVVSPAAYLLFYKRRTAETSIRDSFREVVTQFRSSADAEPNTAAQTEPHLPATQKAKTPPEDVFAGVGHRLGGGDSASGGSQLPWSQA